MRRGLTGAASRRPADEASQTNGRREVSFSRSPPGDQSEHRGFAVSDHALVKAHAANQSASGKAAGGVPGLALGIYQVIDAGIVKQAISGGLLN
jgi:hypothetical protein